VRIEKLKPPILQVTMSAYELATLIAAARWALEGGQGELAPEAIDQLRQVVAGYESASRATAR
jgi:hypothetical protein